MSCDIPEGHSCVGGFHVRKMTRSEALVWWYDAHNIVTPTEEEKRTAKSEADKVTGRDVAYERCPVHLKKRAVARMKRLKAR